MKHLLFILSVIVVSSACTTLNSSDLANSTKTLGLRDCIFIEDWNATINTSYSPTNQTVNLTALGTATDILSGNLYNCNYNLENINQSITPGAYYYNQKNNIYLTCPIKQYGINQRLDFTNNYTNQEAGIIILPPLYPILNQNITPDYSGSFINDSLKLNVTCPAYPKLNLAVPVPIGINYTNHELNLTCIGAEYPKFNENISLECNGTKTYVNPNITVSAPKCLGIVKKMDYGEHIIIPNELDLTAPPAINENLTLIDGGRFFDNASNTDIRCHPSDEQYITFCKNMTEENIVKGWDKINISNMTENQTHIGCFYVDNLTQNCNIDEKFGGKVGFIQCYNRNIDNMNTKITEATDKYNICNTERQQMVTNSQNNKDTTENLSDTSLNIAIGVIAAVMIFLAGWRWLDKKKAERGY